jgi:hypothetical protein
MQSFRATLKILKSGARGKITMLRLERYFTIVPLINCENNEKEEGTTVVILTNY